MSEPGLGRTLFAVSKVAALLGFGALIGLLLGLAYASHLYGTPPVVVQIQNWLAGDTLYQGPAAIDQSDRTGHLHLLNSPVDIIPKIGACLGFFIAASVYMGSFWLRILHSAATDLKKKAKGKPDGDE